MNEFDFESYDEEEEDRPESIYTEKYLIGKRVKIAMGDNMVRCVIENMTDRYIVIRNINEPEHGAPEDKNYDPLAYAYVPGRPYIEMRKHD